MGLFSWLFKKNDKSKSEIKAEAELSKNEAPIASEISKEESAAEEALAESDTDLSEIITVFAGHDATEEERAELVAALEERYPDCLQFSSRHLL